MVFGIWTKQSEAVHSAVIWRERLLHNSYEACEDFGAKSSYLRQG